MCRGLSVTFLTLALAVAPAFANQLTATAGLADGPCGAVTDVGQTPVVFASCQFSNGNQMEEVAVSASASAEANYGLLRAFANLTLSSLLGDAASGQITADASWDDGLSINNLNQNGILEATISLAGVSVANCTTVPFVSSICGIASVEYYAQFGRGSEAATCILTAAGSCTVSVPIIPFNGFASEEFSGYVAVSASADMYDVDGITSPLANYNDTAIVDSLLLVDANGNPIQGAHIVSDSGTDYNSVAPTATPEPSSLLLLGVGSLGLTVLSLKERRRDKLRRRRPHGPRTAANRTN